MRERNYTRRGILKIAALGAATGVVSSCAMEAGSKSAAKTFKFVQMCDTQLGFGNYERDVANFKQAVSQINKLKPDFAAICGDLVQVADEKSFCDFNEIKSGFDVPCYCVAGNHDVGVKPTAESLGYYRENIAQDYYCFEHKGYTFAVVNTSLWKGALEGETEKHDLWFKQVISDAREKNSPIFVFGHYPLYLKSIDEKESYKNMPVNKRCELAGLFQRYGVAAFLTGHTHKLVVNEYEGTQLVCGETTSKNVDKRPYGFRLWSVNRQAGIAGHEFVPLKIKGTSINSV